MALRRTDLRTVPKRCSDDGFIYQKYYFYCYAVRSLLSFSVLISTSVISLQILGCLNAFVQLGEAMYLDVSWV